MRSAGRLRGRARFLCDRCGTLVLAHRTGIQRRPNQRKPAVSSSERPNCQACGRPMIVNGRWKGVPYFRCPCKPTTRTPEGLTALAKSATPRNLPAEVREEVESSIFFDLFTKQIRVRQLLDPCTIRRYVSAAYGMSGDRYRFMSLDAPINEDGSTLKGVLAA